jgi:hypothetical protein
MRSQHKKKLTSKTNPHLKWFTIARLCDEKLGLLGLQLLMPLLMQIARQIGSCCGLLVLPLNESGVMKNWVCRVVGRNC